MKKLLKYILLLVLPITMFAVSSCSDDDDDDKKVNPIVGTWEESFSYAEGVHTSLITFKENGQGYIFNENEDEAEAFSWKIVDDKLQISLADGTIDCKYTIDGDKLIMSYTIDDEVITEIAHRKK